MPLEEFVQIAKVVTSVVSVLILATSVTITIIVYRWSRKKDRIDTAWRFSENLRHYSEVVLSNEDLQEIEAKNHRWGHLEKEDVVRMYRYFILFNVALSLLEAKSKGGIDQPTYEMQMNNFANTTFSDREFIKQNVFPRGYPDKLHEEILARWKTIDSRGTLNSTRTT